MRNKETAVVFAGPSISSSEIFDLKNAGVDVVPPIKRGDLEKYRENNTFLIIDGEFNQSLSVSPKEILAILDAGKKVYGASSMGALRASELYGEGMIGIGWVYEYFMRSKVRFDDDVAMTYIPEAYIPLTVPHVNVVYMTTCWLQSKEITHKEAIAIRKASKAFFFADRTPRLLLVKLNTLLGSARMHDLLKTWEGCFPDIKNSDAKVAVNRLVDSLALKSNPSY